MQLLDDVRVQISSYRKQTSVNVEHRVTLSSNESSAFYNTLSDRVYQKAEQIIEG